VAKTLTTLYAPRTPRAFACFCLHRRLQPAARATARSPIPAPHSRSTSIILPPRTCAYTFTCLHAHRTTLFALRARTRARTCICLPSASRASRAAAAGAPRGGICAAATRITRTRCALRTACIIYSPAHCNARTARGARHLLCHIISAGALYSM